MCGNHLANAERWQAESLSRKYGNQQAIVEHRVTNNLCRIKSNRHRQIGKGADICKCMATTSAILKGCNPKAYPESLSRKHGNQKPCRNIGRPSAFAESSQTDIPKSAKVRPSAFLKIYRPHRLFGSLQIFIRQKSDLIASQTSRNQIT